MALIILTSPVLFTIGLDVLFSPKLQFLAPYLAFGTFAVGSSLIGWLYFGPRDHMLWSDNQIYQFVVHPYILVLIGAQLLLVSGGITVGILVK